MLREKKILNIGKIKIDYSWISVERTLLAMDIYNSIAKMENKTDSKVVKQIVKAVVILIRKDFEFSLDYFRRLFVTERYILKNVNYKDLSSFLDAALEPILGDKKEMKAIEQIETIAEKLLEKMTIEQLNTLLQNALVSTDGK